MSSKRVTVALARKNFLSLFLRNLVKILCLLFLLRCFSSSRSSPSSFLVEIGVVEEEETRCCCWRWWCCCCCCGEEEKDILSFCLDKMENPLPAALCVFIRYTKRSSARVVVFSSSAPFSREQQQMRASLSFLSSESLLYRFYYAATKECSRSNRTYAYSLLFEFLCGVVHEGIFFHRTALNSVLKRKLARTFPSLYLLLVPNVQTHI